MKHLPDANRVGCKLPNGNERTMIHRRCPCQDVLPGEVIRIRRAWWLVGDVCPGGASKPHHRVFTLNGLHRFARRPGYIGMTSRWKCLQLADQTEVDVAESTVPAFYGGQHVSSKWPHPTR